MPSYSLCYPGRTTGFVARNVPRGRSYANLVYDQKTGLVVASSLLQARFASYTEDIDSDPTRVWEPEAPGIEDPKTDTSAIELIDLGDDQEPMLTMDGCVDLPISTILAANLPFDSFEFATNEFVNAISIVELETTATTTGRKEFIAVGTSINRGEDLAVKGAVRAVAACRTFHELIRSYRSISSRLLKLYRQIPLGDGSASDCDAKTTQKVL